MHKKLFHPGAELLLFKFNLSKPLLRTLVTSFIHKSWDSSDDERPSKSYHRHNQSWNNNEDQKPSRSFQRNTQSWDSSDDERPSRSFQRNTQSWGSDDERPSRSFQRNTQSWDGDDVRPSRSFHRNTQSWDSDDERPSRSFQRNIQSWDSDDERPIRRKPAYNQSRSNRWGEGEYRQRRMPQLWNNEEEEEQYRNRPYNSFNRNQNFNVNTLGQNLRRPNWSSIDLQPIKKDFFTHSHNLPNWTEEEIAEFRHANAMKLSGNDVPNPIPSFDGYPFSDEISRYLANMAFDSPTPIQSQGIPIALSGKDMVGIAKTGSGKTLGYILPCLTHIQHQAPLHRRDGPIGLVLGPTRELVQQIETVANEVGRYTGTRTACVFGGANRNTQAKRLYNSPQICIATPGRLLDFLETDVTNLRRCSFLVLDEADMMLDMGFEPQIRKIVDQVRPDRQTLMWSATWPKEVKNLASDFLTNPIQLTVGSLETVANPDIEQQVEVLDSSQEKLDRLLTVLNSELKDGDSKVLIFVKMKRSVEWLTARIARWKAAALHGDVTQRRRDIVMEAFRNGSCRVVVATDVASRGLDVDGISLVVNYDCPDNIEPYIHRIGRTARAGKSGKALTFLTQDNAGIVPELTRVLREANQHVPEEEFARISFAPVSSRKRFAPIRNSFRSRSRW